MRLRAFVTALILSLSLPLFAHHGPDKIKIDAAAKKQPPVTFTHSQHVARAHDKCDTCHHTQKGLKTDKDTKVVKCTVCHLDPKKPGQPSMREMSLVKNPFHIRCIGCHKEAKKGPVVCTGCHKKM